MSFFSRTKQETEKTYIVGLTREAVRTDPITIKATTIQQDSGFFIFNHGKEMVCTINEKLVEKIILTEVEGQ